MLKNMAKSVVPLYTENELKRISHDFFIELQNANNGKIHCVPFLIHYLSQKDILPENCIFQIMVFGGTIFKSAIVNKNGREIKIVSQQESQIPNFSNDDIFLSFIRNNLDTSINFLAVNFAFSLSPTVTGSLLDGVLIQGAKEHVFINIIGKPVGKTISEYILQKNNKKINVTVANDTICLLLANVKSATWDNTIGGIIGTGTNYSFALGNNKIVNLESGNFKDFSPTETGKIIDAMSSNIGKELIEKEISGAYLFKHFNEILKQNKITHTLLGNTSQLSEIASLENKQLSEIAQKILERSASLAACQIAGIVQFKNTVGIKKLTFVMEGNLFWSGWQYKQMLENYLKLLGVYDSIRFSPIQHSSIQGAIRLLLPVNCIE